MSAIYSTSPNFKSQIRENDYYRAAIDAAKKDLTKQDYHKRRGVNTLKALNGIDFDGSINFVEFFQKGDKVYTKINGAVDESRTFPARNGYGTNAQYAIIQYAQSQNAFSKEPISEYEKKVIDLKKELVKAEEAMYKDFQNRLNRYY